MSENVVARLREIVSSTLSDEVRTIANDYAEDEDGIGGGSDYEALISVQYLLSALPTLLDIVEAVAATLEPRDHEWCCYYCESPLHAPHFANCPYLRAREICGMDGDE